jgi:type IV secretory pathway VirB2 component (pilin)
MIQPIARGHQRLATTATALTLSFLLAPAAHASGSSMPWEAPLQSILQSIEGPVAKIIAVIIIIVTGLTLAFSGSSPMLARAGRTRSAAFRTHSACRPVSSATSIPTAPRWRL